MRMNEEYDMYYEIDYDACPIPGVGKYVLKPQKIESPEKDAVRGIFGQMRDIERNLRPSNDFFWLFEKYVHPPAAAIFYNQGMFMKDFADNYSGSAPFSQHFPCYQIMGYEQLRTYFTWRTKIRAGNVTNISMSYIFLYVYELLNNIGVSDPQNGLDKLMSFWKEIRVYISGKTSTVDKYITRWLKDYHIYYELPWSFGEFVEKNNLYNRYPEMINNENNFDSFCSISKYDVRRSAFYIANNEQLIKDCFRYVIERIRQSLEDVGANFDEIIFWPTKRMLAWTPFSGAVFYQKDNQPDKRVVISENELYIRYQNRWSFSTTLITESGKQLIGYIIKQMESELRKLTKYKNKIVASVNSIPYSLVRQLNDAGLSLETTVNRAVAEFYQESTRTVVTVDHDALAKIRREAYITQEKLIVPEDENVGMDADAMVTVNPDAMLGADADATVNADESVSTEKIRGSDERVGMTADAIEGADVETTVNADADATVGADADATVGADADATLGADADAMDSVDADAMLGADADATVNADATPAFDAAKIPPFEAASAYDMPDSFEQSEWRALKSVLTETEIEALSAALYAVLNEEGDAVNVGMSGHVIRSFANERGIMPEVLIDGVNEKAMDFVGDSLFDEEFTLYDDYLEQIKDLTR